MARSTTTTVIYAALFGNLAIAITKFGAAFFTGSSAMISEGVHSLVDTFNEILLLYGLRRAGLPRDRHRPFGYGRELYFWSFVVALLIFSLGAGVSIYEGIVHLQAQEPMSSPVINYAVLSLSIVFEGISWWIALKAFRATKGDLGYFAAFRASKDPATFTVLLEDTAALLGLMIALAGVALAHGLGDPRFDGAASICIGLLLAATAVFLARECKGLLMGEAASPVLHAALLELAASDPAIRTAHGVVTVHLGPTQIFAALSAEFDEELRAPEIEDCVDRLEAKIKAAHPEVTTLLFRPQSKRSWRQSLIELKAGDGI